MFLTGGKNAKAVRTKFRIGGLMLTVSGMLSLTSCEGGDKIEVTIKDSPYNSHSYKFLVNGEDVLQQKQGRPWKRHKLIS